MAAQLTIPVALRRPAGAPPLPATAAASAEQALAPGHPAEAGRLLAGGAPQPAVAAAAAEQAVEPEQLTGGDALATGGAPQPAAAAAAKEQALEPEQPAGADRPATGGAPQPAAAASAAEQALEPEKPAAAHGPAAAAEQAPASGAPQPVTASAESAETAEDREVEELHEKLREVEEAEDISPAVKLELGRILFKKKTVSVGGIPRQYVASREETVSSIKKLLQRRRAFMAARNLHDDPYGAFGGASQPGRRRYLFTQEDRRQLMQEWKTEFHATTDQREQQLRDSNKPLPKRHTKRPREQDTPPAGQMGPNKDALRSGMHSRFSRHLQLEAGSKAGTSGSALETPLVRTPHFHMGWELR